jgi:DNA-binding CsgD family transcriptional regulator/PAS domain-containing protein
MDLDQSTLGELYAAAECPSGWPKLLDGLCTEVRMRSAVAQVLDVGVERARQLWCERDATSQRNADLHDRFINTAGNPRFDAKLRRDSYKSIGSDARSFGETPQLLTDLQQRLDRGGLGAAIWLSFPIDYHRGFTLILHREPGDFRDLNSAEERYLEALLPHLMRAVRLNTSIGPMRARAEGFQSALDRLNTSIMMIRVDGSVDWHNAAAERLLQRSSAVCILAGRLQCAELGDRQRLRDLVAEVQAGVLPMAMLAVGRCGEMPLHLRIEPLGGRFAGLGEQDADGGVALFLSEPGAAVALDPAAVSELFGLTPAEAHLAAALAGGSSVAEHAVQRGISVGTARVQLKQVLAKTETSRQSELVRRLCGSVAGMGIAN